MVSTLAEEQKEISEAKRLIATVPLIAEVEAIEVELYTDNTGDPAFELLFRIKSDVEVDRPFYSALQ
jgi:hypothetical protein